MVSLNVKSLTSLVRRTAYVGRNYDWYTLRFPIIRQMVDLSVLGNPYKSSNPDWRSLYRKHLWKLIQQKGDAYKALHQIASEDLDIACWCKPAPCHCDVIENAVKWIKNGGSDE